MRMAPNLYLSAADNKGVLSSERAAAGKGFTCSFQIPYGANSSTFRKISGFKFNSRLTCDTVQRITAKANKLFIDSIHEEFNS